mgnify:FL=1|jgi:hypothetical protein
MFRIKSGSPMSRGMIVIGLISSSVSISNIRAFSPYDTDSCLDDVNLVEGMPVGIQVVGGRFGEEKCVAVAKAIEQAMQGKITSRARL